MAFTLEDHTNAIAAYLPNGLTFEAKGISGSNFRQLLTGIAGEFQRAQCYIQTLEDEFIPDLTTLFIDEWEQAVGIPDDCFTGSGTADERRRDILTKLAVLGTQTPEDFEAVALVFGVVADVLSGVDSGIVFPDIATARYTIVVNATLSESLPYTLPFTLGSDLLTFLECIFNKIKPENCQVLFQGV